MFTGIIETTGTVQAIDKQGSNLSFIIQSRLSNTFKTDQSVAHNGVCLTIEEVMNDTHRVTAVAETISKTNLAYWQVGSLINIERCLPMNGRLDGHFVQGHVDATAKVIDIQVLDGSWQYTFEYPQKFAALLIEKGSISMNGTSLTMFNVTNNQFTIAIIPYTYHHTNINQLAVGDMVNIEFDMVGKYINRYQELK